LLLRGGTKSNKMQFGLQLTLEPEVQESLHSLQKALPSMHIPIQVRVPEADEEQLAKAEVVAAKRPSLQDKDALVCHVNGLVPSPRVTLQLLENEDAASALLSLLPPAALAKVSLVCKSWRMAAEDERLWKAHCLNDPHCKSVMCSMKVLRLGGWRRFYCSRSVIRTLILG